MVHDLADFPSINTVQAPQLEVSQPMCVPVEDNFSLIRCTSKVLGSTSAAISVPFNLIFISMIN
jgi:translation elongation factor EF-Tu-like GTPase